MAAKTKLFWGKSRTYGMPIHEKTRVRKSHATVPFRRGGRVSWGKLTRDTNLQSGAQLTLKQILIFKPIQPTQIFQANRKDYKHTNIHKKRLTPKMWCNTCYSHNSFVNWSTLHKIFIFLRSWRECVMAISGAVYF